MPQRLRVLRVIARLNVGGPAIHATLLNERLDPARFESTLVAGSEAAGEASYLDLHGRTLRSLVTIPDLGRELSGVRDVSALRQVIAVIRQTRPHIVHTHTAKAGALGRTAAWLCRVPVIVHTYHGHVLHGYFSPARTRVFAGIERALARVSDALVTVSPKVRDELVAFGVGRAEQYHVVPLGFDLDRFTHADAKRGELRAELGIDAFALLVGIVARLVPIKHHELFLEAAAIVRERRPDTHFVVVGDGECRADLERLAERLGLGGHVHFLGWRADLDRIYADLDLVALTSKNEGSPVALIEAMAAGRAVVATDVGGVADVVADGETGRLVPAPPAGTATLFADALLSLAEAPALRESFGREGRRGVLARYGASRLVRDIEALYETLVAAHPRLRGRGARG